MKKNNIYNQIYDKLNSDNKDIDKPAKREDKKDNKPEEVKIDLFRWLLRDLLNWRMKLKFIRNFIKIMIRGWKY